MNISKDRILQQGIALHKEGKLHDAERVYRNILQTQPLHPDANHNLGVLAVAVNKTKEALPFFEIAVKANPKIDQFWLSYIDALIITRQFINAEETLKRAKEYGVDSIELSALESKLPPSTEKSNSAIEEPSKERLNSKLKHYQHGQVSDAEKLAERMTHEFPRHPFAWKVLGAILSATGRKSAAVEANQTAVKLSPKYSEAHSNLGITLQELGRLGEAEKSYAQALALKPDFAEAHYNLSATLQELGRLNEAEASGRQAITLKPDYAEAHSNLGVTFCKLKKLYPAEECYKRAITLKPNFAEAHNNLGVTLKELGKLKEAEASFNKAISVKPDHAEAHSNLGVALNALGRLDEAEGSFLQAIALKPDFAEAHRHLTSTKKFMTQDDQYSKMLELYREEDITEDHRCHINFGLAKACEDLGDFEQAFIHYSEGNDIRKKMLNYDIKTDIGLFSKLKSAYPKIERNSLAFAKSAESLIPIFILGMPRSGTTLVKQIVSSRSEVTGAGELDFARRFGAGVATGMSVLNDESILDFRQKYLRELQQVSEGNLLITDKMPQNFRYIGLLSAALPEAKIIHA